MIQIRDCLIVAQMDCALDGFLSRWIKIWLDFDKDGLQSGWIFIMMDCDLDGLCRVAEGGCSGKTRRRSQFGSNHAVCRPPTHI